MKDDAADKQNKITCSLLLPWDTKGTVGKLYDIVAIWQAKATHVSRKASDCKHSPHEKTPEESIKQFLDSLK